MAKTRHDPRLAELEAIIERSRASLNAIVGEEQASLEQATIKAVQLIEDLTVENCILREEHSIRHLWRSIRKWWERHGP